MSKEFYNYIAQKIVAFFSQHEENMAEGSRFCLKLDTVDRVEELEASLKQYILENQELGTWSYRNPYTNQTTYETYTLKLQKSEIAIVCRTQNMKDDFLATLRNQKKTMLMIASTPIDSVVKGTDSFSAKGFPFHYESIIEDIKQRVEHLPLRLFEQEILRLELERRGEDAFSDRNSLFEYENLLDITSGPFSSVQFASFRLFKDEEISAIDSIKGIKARIKENNEWFEKIDRAVKYGNISRDLEKDFSVDFIELLRKEQLDWETKITFEEVKKALQKKEKLKVNPLDFLGYEVYSSSPMEHMFHEDVDYFVNEDGVTAAKKRKKNILVFNPSFMQPITINLAFNRPLKKDELNTADDAFVLYGKRLSLEIEHSERMCSFHVAKISDSSSSIKFEFRVLIVDIPSNYLNSYLTSFTIQPAKKNMRLKLISNNCDLIINSEQEEVDTLSLVPDESYSASFSKALRLQISEDLWADHSKGVPFTLSIGNVKLPVLVVDMLKETTLLTPREAFRQKNMKKSNFVRKGENAFVFGNKDYYVKEEFRKILNLEQEIVSNAYQAIVVDLNDNVDSIALRLPIGIQQAYQDLVGYYAKEKLLPSLTYLNEELKGLAKRYVDQVLAYFENIQEHMPINQEAKDVLKLGTVSYISEAQEICFSPFHPLSVVYQLTLLEELSVDNLNTALVNKLSCVNLLPYIQNEYKTLYRSIDLTSSYSMEWICYAPVVNKKYKGARNFISKLVSEKIKEYKLHFPCLFSELNNRSFHINVIDMGDCEEILVGLMNFFAKELGKVSDPELLTEFTIHVYDSNINTNAFQSLTDFKVLKEFISNSSVRFDSIYTDNDIANILTKKLRCFFHNKSDAAIEYAHISFYEMNSKPEIGRAKSNSIISGVMLNGLTSGVPSVYYGDQYRTGFGSKYAKETEILRCARYYNALHQVSETGNPYTMDNSFSTELDKLSVDKIDAIYKASNWVTFVDPKVDLNFFKDDEHTDLLIIHYSDQYTSTSGYDAITVTQKSKQYEDVLKEYLKNKAVDASLSDLHAIIDLFNAVNGEWLLGLLSTLGQFSREKISILSAIKFALAYYKHSDIIWVPISLEELLRVSGAVGLSADDGLLSAKNLGFEKCATCDDIMLVGIENKTGKVRVHLHPIEVKIGNTSALVGKAAQQLQQTSKAFSNALWPENAEERNSIERKLIRNFVMQLVVISAEKMKIYNVWPEEQWDKILSTYRTALLNDEFEISEELYPYIKAGSTIAFDCNAEIGVYKKDGDFELIEIPERTAISWLTAKISDIEKALLDEPALQKQIENFCFSQDESTSVNQVELLNLDDDLVDAVFIPAVDPTPEPLKVYEEVQGEEEVTLIVENVDAGSVVEDHSDCTIADEQVVKGIEVIFGQETINNQSLVWEPGNTNKVLHTNTGIIGTMGTGKTQFTKALVTQLHREQKFNVNETNLGILIFDYKGDYNQSKMDFVSATNAKVLSLYHLPFNPLAISKPKVFKNLLPRHIANAFKDTISKVYGLGPKQQNTLLNCIMEAYQERGIVSQNASTWSNDPPTFSDVYRIYVGNDDIKKDDKLDAAMQKLQGFELFEEDVRNTTALFDLIDGVTVIDLSGYDSDIQNLIVAITLDLFYAQMQSRGSSSLEGNFRELTKLILVDEADNFMSEGFPTLKKILKEGREFGVGTILSTQFLKHFGTGEDDYSKYILTWVVHKVADLRESDVRFVFNTEANSAREKELFNDVKQLDKHYSIVKMGNSTTPHYIEDKAFWKIIEAEKDKASS